MNVKKFSRLVCILLSLPSVAFAETDCLIPNNVKFLPDTSPPLNGLPRIEPGGLFPRDCEFYKWAWQTFLYTTHIGDKRPRFLEYATFQDVFKVSHSPLFAKPKIGLLSLAPRTIEHANNEHTTPDNLSELEQASSEAVLIDSNGNPIWYQIHLNPTFVDFINANDLTNVDVLKNISQNYKDLEFRTGSVEFKSAWQIIEKPSPDFISAQAAVPFFKRNEAGNIIPDGQRTREVTVALIGLHVVGVIEGHPEFIWATFEHTSLTKDAKGDRIRDVAPSAKVPLTTDIVTQSNKYFLYPSEAPPVAKLNNGIKFKDLQFDEITQKFSPTSAIYRVYPASKQLVTEINEDGEIVTLNRDIQNAFEKLEGKDARSNYSLVGAVWFNAPREDFLADKYFPPDAPASFKGFGGEDGLSNMCCESFTQIDKPNCFSCHDTLKAGTKNPKLGATRLNVSHVLSKYFDLIKK